MQPWGGDGKLRSAERSACSRESRAGSILAGAAPYLATLTAPSGQLGGTVDVRDRSCAAGRMGDGLVAGSGGRAAEVVRNRGHHPNRVTAIHRVRRLSGSRRPADRGVKDEMRREVAKNHVVRIRSSRRCRRRWRRLQEARASLTVCGMSELAARLDTGPASHGCASARSARRSEAADRLHVMPRATERAVNSLTMCTCRSESDRATPAAHSSLAHPRWICASTQHSATTVDRNMITDDRWARLSLSTGTAYGIRLDSMM